MPKKIDMQKCDGFGVTWQVADAGLKSGSVCFKLELFVIKCDQQVL